MAGMKELTRLQAKWQNILKEHAFESVILLDTSRLQWPCTLGYLRVQASDGTAHDFRLSANETAEFVTVHDDPNATYTYDPLYDPFPDPTVYLSGGVPDAVSEVLTALEITPLWSTACSDGEHEFEQIRQENWPTIYQCSQCENSRTVLSWIGHAVDLPELEENFS
ncbi:hypothetical protein [Halalkalicoccus salilacus]|uniref:hypothetical protein n=1 Tax=Halalkalicoccus salilacus TaxID=3117459 RepID=UPI00300E7EB3